MDDFRNNTNFNSRLEEMQKNLYRAKSSEELQKPESTLLPKRKFNEKTTWEIEGETPRAGKKSLTSSFLFKVLIFSIIFFFVAVGVSLYLFFYGFNIISGRNIEIEIQGPKTIKAGDEINLQTTITNNNKAKLSSVSLIFNYPAGTLSAVDRATAFPVDEQKIGIIDEKQVANVTSRAIIFGARNTEQEIKLTMEYRLPDSNAIYTKEKTFTVTMGASPIDLSIDLPSEINSGQEFSMVVKMVSNSETVLKNVFLSLEFPATGFMLKNAEPQSLAGGKVWQLGDLPSGSERTIKIVGILEGQNEDVKSFKAKVSSSLLGSAEDSEAFEYGEAFSSATIKRSFVNVNLAINGSNRQEVVVKPGGDVEVFVNWSNNLSDRVIDGKVVVKLNSEIIDKYTISSPDGFYNSSAGTITWDKNNIPGLADLGPSETGNSSFKFKLINFAKDTTLERQSFKVYSTFEGQRVGADQLSKVVTSDSSRVIKIETVPTFVARSVYSLGPLKNTGPLPPRVDSETTFSVLWSITNTTNSLREGKVKTTLPSNVNWVGSFSPADEKIVYDPSTREVSWDIGDVSAGVGHNSSEREAYFQVSITPSLSQLGQFVRLTNKAVFQAVDSFTNTVITKEQDAVTTKLINDPNSDGKTQVIE